MSKKHLLYKHRFSGDIVEYLEEEQWLVFIGHYNSNKVSALSESYFTRNYVPLDE